MRASRLPLQPGSSLCRCLLLFRCFYIYFCIYSEKIFPPYMSIPTDYFAFNSFNDFWELRVKYHVLHSYMPHSVSFTGQILLWLIFHIFIRGLRGVGSILSVLLFGMLV